MRRRDRRQRRCRVAERFADFRQALPLGNAFILRNLQHVPELSDETFQHVGMFKLVFLQPDLRIRLELAHHLDEDLGDIVGRLPQLRLDEQHRERMTLRGLERSQFRNVERPRFGDQLGPLADGQDRGRHRRAFGQYPDLVDMLEEAGDRSIDCLVAIVARAHGEALQRRQRRQFVPAPNQFLDKHVEDVGQFGLGSGFSRRKLAQPRRSGGIERSDVGPATQQLLVTDAGA
ncbi:hypothetical protein WL02_05590 [Burkholderia ubonensis]|nr:hypothetical protein WJ67_28855 [Burkholderia ubonensis]KVX23003.1 hypothetical protein WL02_05590 [Burkholderia ubonensis]